MSSGKLYLVATPIGNLEDISFRALKTLENVEIIAAEDKRETIKLLNHFKISKRLIDYHKHNEHERAEVLIEHLKNGKDIALVSDAGLPIISDPGSVLVSRCEEEEIPVYVIPGANAALSALVLSGLDTTRFTFFGFPGKKKSEEREFIEEIVNSPHTAIIYESPHHLTKLLERLKAQIPERRASISRELTKLHEETLRGSIEELTEHFRENPPRGEFVLIVEGAPEVVTGNDYMLLSLEEHVERLVSEGKSEKEAIKEVAKVRGLNKREVYEIVKIKK